MGPHSREPRNVKTQKCGALRNPKRCIFVSQLFQFSKNSNFKTSKPSPTTQKSKFFTSRFPQISRLPRLFCCLLNRVRSTYIYSNLLTTKKPPTPPPISPEIRQIASSTRQTENSSAAAVSAQTPVHHTVLLQETLAAVETSKPPIP